jgi:phenylalanyl-tRNA synthetase beta chain
MSFIPPRWLDVLDVERAYLPATAETLHNAISEETSLMRTSLLPGLLEAVRFNVNRRVTDVQLFEMGRVFIPTQGEKLPREPLMLGCALTGDWLPQQWDREAERVDFYTAKGIFEGLTDSLGIVVWSLRREELPFLHPSRSCVITIDGEDAGYLGLIHPRLAEEADMPENTALLEVDVAMLVAAAQTEEPYREIPRFPSVQMDLAVVVGEGVDALDVEEAIRGAGGDLLREVRLFDLYRGEQLKEGEKSLAYGLTFFALDRTLRDEEARAAYERIIKVLEAEMDARLRS